MSSQKNTELETKKLPEFKYLIKCKYFQELFPEIGQNTDNEKKRRIKPISLAGSSSNNTGKIYFLLINNNQLQ